MLRPQPETIELGGRTADTWTYGAGIPGPELRLKQGERVRIRVENGLPEDTTVHWHGLRVANDVDGVPDMPLPPIKPGGSFTYEFAPPDAGTYWFHPHVGMQLDRGLYGALIVEARDEPLAYDREAVLVLDDWLDGIAGTPDAKLKEPARPRHADARHGHERRRRHVRDGHGASAWASATMDVSALGDGSLVVPGRYVTLTGEDPVSGTLPALGNLLAAKQLDAGDVQFPLYLVNGRPPGDPYGVEVRRGERVRLRVINAAADTMFALSVDDHPLTLVASDGQAVEPVKADAVLARHGRARRPAARGDEARRLPHRRAAARQDGPRSRDAALRRRAALDDAVRARAGRSAPARMVAYEDLRDAAGAETAKPDREIRLDLAQDMSKPYRWTMGGQSFPEADMIDVAHGERVRFVIRNRTMMAHPMHLHGHFLRDATTSAGAGR